MADWIQPVTRPARRGGDDRHLPSCLLHALIVRSAGSVAVRLAASPLSGSGDEGVRARINRGAR